jgi:lysozyme family protein
MPMEESFNQAFAYTVGNEGKYTNDRFDSGGPTNWGITQADYAQFKGRSVSIQEVKDMPLEDARQIYYRRYWLPLSLSQISHNGVAICMFDIGVVRGIGVPPIYAQQICGVTVDGHIGPITLAAINAMEPSSFITAFAAKTRNGFLGIVARRPTQLKFIKGWLRRAARLLTLIRVK